MTTDTPSLLQHSHFDGVAGYVAALDTLCGLAERNLYIFEKNLDGLGFNTEARYETLRHFLLGGTTHRIYLLVQDDSYISKFCPRILLLLQKFSSGLLIHRLPKNLQHLTTPFAVADDTHCVRRYHFDDPRGVFEQHDESSARRYKSYFLEMWTASHPAISATKLGL